jgi:sulfur carrier protein ThiS
MRVGVTLFGHYSRLLPPESRNGRASLEFEEATTVGDVLDRLQIPPEGRTYLTVNGTHVGQDTILSQDDEIRVIVPLGGG